MTGLITRVRGWHTNNGALPSLYVSAEEKTLARLPGLKFWLDPQARFESLGSRLGIRDRKGRLDSTLNSPGAPYTLGGVINGQPTVTFTNATLQGLKYASATSLNFMAGGYTVVAVAKRTGITGNFKFFELYNNILSVFTGTDLRIYVMHNAVSSNTSAVVLDGGAHIIQAAWNPVTGLSTVQIDGVVKAMFSGAKAAPDLSGVTTFSVGTGSGVVNGQTADMGHVMIFDRDLTAVENTSTRSSMLTALGAKYGIAVTL